MSIEALWFCDHNCVVSLSKSVNRQKEQWSQQKVIQTLFLCRQYVNIDEKNSGTKIKDADLGMEEH